MAIQLNQFKNFGFCPLHCSLNVTNNNSQPNCAVPVGSKAQLECVYKLMQSRLRINCKKTLETPTAEWTRMMKSRPYCSSSFDQTAKKSIEDDRLIIPDQLVEADHLYVHTTFIRSWSSRMWTLFYKKLYTVYWRIHVGLWCLFMNIFCCRVLPWYTLHALYIHELLASLILQSLIIHLVYTKNNVKFNSWQLEDNVQKFETFDHNNFWIRCPK